MVINHLVIEPYVDHDHFSNHADPPRTTGIVGVHTTSEPHLKKQQIGEKSHIAHTPAQMPWIIPIQVFFCHKVVLLCP